ncbi:MAG: L-threonylcarbamoyladenylate synthase [Bacteroidota bacterium]
MIGKDVEKAAALLREGKLVAIPTETVYGLAGNGLSEMAVAQIFAVKERPSFDPLILHVSSIDRVEEYTHELSTLARQLAAAFWPGPLTLVLPRRSIVPDLVTAGLDSVAIRVPGHSLTRTLLSKLHFPLAAPSANPFGYISPTTAQHVAQQLGDKIDYILDGGPAQVGLESTIVSFINDTPQILRKGGIPQEDIFSYLGKEIPVSTHSTSNPQAPGMLAKHYAPKVPFSLANQLADNFFDSSGAVAWITFGEREALPNGVSVFNLSESGDFYEAARRLFGLLRQLDGGNFEHIVADLVPEKGLGRAINDRLRRAAAR